MIGGATQSSGDNTPPTIKQDIEQGVALNTCPAASSIRYDHSTFNPLSKPRPRAGVRGLRRWAENEDRSTAA